MQTGRGGKMGNRESFSRGVKWFSGKRSGVMRDSLKFGGRVEGGGGGFSHKSFGTK